MSLGLGLLLLSRLRHLLLSGLGVASLKGLPWEVSLISSGCQNVGGLAELNNRESEVLSRAGEKKLTCFLRLAMMFVVEADV